MPRLRLNPYLLLTMLLWGFNFVALKLVLVQMTPAAAALIRYVIMYAALLAMCKAAGMDLKYPKGDTVRILFQGFLAMGIYMVFFTLGMLHSSAAEGAIILGTAPIFTLILAVMTKQEKFYPSTLIGIAVAFFGVSLVVYGGQQLVAVKVEDPQLLADHLRGNLLIFASAILWALATVVSRPLVGRHEPLRVQTLSMPGGAIAMIPFGLYDTLHTDWGSLTLTTWAMLLYFALLAGALGFVFFYKGVQQIGASGAMVYQYLVSPTAAVFGFFVLSSPLHPLQLVGLVVVLTGVALSSHARQTIERRRNEATVEAGAKTV